MRSWFRWSSYYIRRLRMLYGCHGVAFHCVAGAQDAEAPGGGAPPLRVVLLFPENLFVLDSSPANGGSFRVPVAFEYGQRSQECDHLGWDIIDVDHCWFTHNTQSLQRIPIPVKVNIYYI